MDWPNRLESWLRPLHFGCLLQKKLSVGKLLVRHELVISCPLIVGFVAFLVPIFITEVVMHTFIIFKLM
jgi:hypothetical protein